MLVFGDFVHILVEFPSILNPAITNSLVALWVSQVDAGETRTQVCLDTIYPLSDLRIWEIDYSITLLV
ncbi:hypothetical protein NTCA1_31760 [Novosphingobium sp. TCA1]|nr:hypothetical protein NTCA1_31760 [Novosphingobium sp. TCA1]